MVFPGDAVYNPQHYPAWVFLDVESEVTGQLPKGIKIPEDMSQYHAGAYITAVLVRELGLI